MYKTTTKPNLAKKSVPKHSSLPRKSRLIKKRNNVNLTRGGGSRRQLSTNSTQNGEFSRIIHGPKIEIPQISIIERVISHTSNPQRLFYRQNGKVYSYTNLLEHSLDCSEKLGKLLSSLPRHASPTQTTTTTTSLSNSSNMVETTTVTRAIGHRVCILAPSSFEYSSYTNSVWLNNAVAVPLYVEHPVNEMLYYLQDSQAKVIIAHPKFKTKAEELLHAYKKSHHNSHHNSQNPATPPPQNDSNSDVQLLVLDEYETNMTTETTPFVSLEGINENLTQIGPSKRDSLCVQHPKTGKDVIVPLPNMDDPCLFIYTSGTTTGLGKAVSLTHRNITTQIRGMIQNWKWTGKDHILDMLPKHHVHGVINVIYTATWVGARVTSPVSQKFDSNTIWNEIQNGVDNSIQSQLVLTPTDLNKFKNRTSKSQNIMLECGADSRVLPALHHALTNYTPEPGHYPIPKRDAYTLFMAVPTIYHKLLEQYEQYDAQKQELLSKACSQFRMFVSGSMALPLTTLNKWQHVTYHKLLERYGMSEIGMGVTNDYDGERIPGSIGWPFPGVRVRVQVKHDDDFDAGKIGDKKKQEQNDWDNKNEQNNIKNEQAEDVVGELLIQGDTVFKYYFNRPEQTAESFINIQDDDGSNNNNNNNNNKNPDGTAHDSKWFLTGDIAKISGKDNCITLLGRNSVDILKISGYKVSALGIERALLEHPGIQSVAVVGLPSETTGQSVAAIVVPKKGWKIGSNATQKNGGDGGIGGDHEWQNGVGAGIGESFEGNVLDFDGVIGFAKDMLPKYQLPREICIVDSIPVNAMGKINKKSLTKFLLEKPEFSESKWRQ